MPIRTRIRPEMSNEKSNNGYPENPYEDLLDDEREGGLAPTGDPYDMFWHFKDEALINPKNSRNDGYLKELFPMLLDRIDRYHTYEIKALHFESTSDLLKWIRSDEDLVDWAWTHRTYRRLLEESN